MQEVVTIKSEIANLTSDLETVITSQEVAIAEQINT